MMNILRHKMLFVLAIMTIGPLAINTSQCHAEGNGGIMRIINWLTSGYADKVDSLYIKAPEKAWKVVLKAKANESVISMKSHIDVAEIGYGSSGELTWKSRNESKPESSLGVQVAYHGLGLTLSKGFGKKQGFNFMFDKSGYNYAGSIRYRSGKAFKTNAHVYGIADGRDIDYDCSLDLTSPIKSEALILEGLYFFNSKRYSYAAALNQSMIQRRTSGSPLVGFLTYFTDINFASPDNIEMLTFMDGIGRIKVAQVSIGCGYAYNYVPADNWLISAFLMPMATVFDRSKLYRYLDSEEKWIDKPTTSRRTKNLDYNIDGRMSVYYSWDDMFMCLNGQLSHFFYKQGKTTGQTIDWFAILSLGYCF